ncbi:MAG: hypothetical protein H0V04_08405, partial [Chloroflexi bacterium]|nr:hypothetical protein [Chloroflexota bacterium]
MTLRLRNTLTRRVEPLEPLTAAAPLAAAGSLSPARQDTFAGVRIYT